MTYRVAPDLLEKVFPIDAGTDPETLRRHSLRVGEGVADRPAIRPETSPPAITVALDSTFIRSCEDGERHLGVRVGNVEIKSGARQVFGAVAKTDTDIKVLIRRSLDAVGRSEGAELTAFTDGCPGLRRVLADAGVAETPILDWFHIGMRLEHLKQIADALTTGNPARVAAKAVIVTEVERLHWRIWNGKAKDAPLVVAGFSPLLFVRKSLNLRYLASATSAGLPSHFSAAEMAKRKRWLEIPTELSLEWFREFVLPHLTVGSRGPAPKSSFRALFNYILKLLYLGCQWKELPIERDEKGRREVHHTSVYRVFRR
jgi:hypothetical protein